MTLVKFVLRLMWLSLFATCIYAFYTIITEKIYTKDKHLCNITNIVYPTSFDDLNNWNNCTCGNIYCTGMCYCIKLYTSERKNYVIQNTVGINQEFKDCTFSSSYIPFNFDFTPIISKYENTTIDCWYDNNDIYIYPKVEIYSRLVILIFIIILFTCMNVFCIYIESIHRNKNKKNRNKNKININIKEINKLECNENEINYEIIEKEENNIEKNL